MKKYLVNYNPVERPFDETVMPSLTPDYTYLGERLVTEIPKILAEGVNAPGHAQSRAELVTRIAGMFDMAYAGGVRHERWRAEDERGYASWPDPASTLRQVEAALAELDALKGSLEDIRKGLAKKQ